MFFTDKKDGCDRRWLWPLWLRKLISPSGFPHLTVTEKNTLKKQPVNVKLFTDKKKIDMIVGDTCDYDSVSLYDFPAAHI